MLRPRTEPIRVAVIGCGVIGAVHADVLAAGPDTIVSALVSGTAASATRLVKRITEAGQPAPQVFDRLDAALEHCDAVVICTPSGTHADLAVAALSAGKHVLIEKPIDIDQAGAQRIAAAVRAAPVGTVAAVVSQHRFDPSAIAVHGAAVAGSFGRITSAVATIAWWRPQAYYDSAAWRGTRAVDGGGALINQGIHTLDLLCWVLGRPVSVSAQARTVAHDGIDVEDTVVATVAFASGALAIVLATTAAYPGLTARLQIHGSQGSAVIDDDRLVYAHTADGRLDNTADPDSPDGTDGQTDLVVALGRQWQDFVTSIDTGTPATVDVADAARTLALVSAIYESAETGRPVSFEM